MPSPALIAAVRPGWHTLIKALPDNSITLFDKLFHSADLLLTLSRSGENRHWLLPARKDIVSEVQESYGAGDRLLKMKVSAGSKTEPVLTGVLVCTGGQL